MMIETLASMGGALTARSIENPKTPLHAIFDVEPAWSGKSVNAETAMTLTAVWRAIDLISSTFAKLPLETFAYTSWPDYEPRPDHYLWPLLTRQVNSRMTAFRWKRQMMTWALTAGNAYSVMEISGRGQVVALYPMRPDRVRVEGPDKGVMYYRYTTENGEELRIPESLVFHLRGLEMDGSGQGLSPIQNFRNTIGSGLSMAEHVARYYGQGARPGGVLTHPGVLNKDAREKLRDDWERMHKGPENAHRVAVLQEGMTYSPIVSTMKDAEIVSLLGFGVEDIGRIYGIPQHMLGKLDRSTNNNIEHQGIEFESMCISPWAANFESEAIHSFLSPSEQMKTFVRFRTSELRRGDADSQASALEKKRRYITVNEGRRELGLPRIAEGGDEPLVQQQDIPLSMAGKIEKAKEPKQIGGGE